MATTFTPPLYDLSATAGTNRLLLAASKVYNVGQSGLILVDRVGGMTAAQVSAALRAFVEAHEQLPTSNAVTEIIVTTV